MATLCREAADSCDLGEYCDGISEFCPSDAYVVDGRDCQTDEVSQFDHTHSSALLSHYYYYYYHYYY